MKKLINLENDFHKTKCKVKAEVQEDFIKVSNSSIERARKKLCGMDDCSCGGVPAPHGEDSEGNYYYY